MNKNDMSGSAFPSHGTMGKVVQEGMTLRDYFAAKAMAAIIAKHDPSISVTVRGKTTEFADGVAGGAYNLADAMLAERAK